MITSFDSPLYKSSNENDENVETFPLILQKNQPNAILEFWNSIIVLFFVIMVIESFSDKSPMKNAIYSPVSYNESQKNYGFRIMTSDLPYYGQWYNIYIKLILNEKNNGTIFNLNISFNEKFSKSPISVFSSLGSPLSSTIYHKCRHIIVDSSINMIVFGPPNLINGCFIEYETSSVFQFWVNMVVCISFTIIAGMIGFSYLNSVKNSENMVHVYYVTSIAIQMPFLYIRSVLMFLLWIFSNFLYVYSAVYIAYSIVAKISSEISSLSSNIEKRKGIMSISYSFTHVFFILFSFFFRAKSTLSISIIPFLISISYSTYLLFQKYLLLTKHVKKISRNQLIFIEYWYLGFSLQILLKTFACFVSVPSSFYQFIIFVSNSISLIVSCVFSKVIYCLPNEEPKKSNQKHEKPSVDIIEGFLSHDKKPGMDNFDLNNDFYAQSKSVPSINNGDIIISSQVFPDFGDLLETNTHNASNNNGTNSSTLFSLDDFLGENTNQPPQENIEENQLNFLITNVESNIDMKNDIESQSLGIEESEINASILNKNEENIDLIGESFPLSFE